MICARKTAVLLAIFLLATGCSSVPPRLSLKPPPQLPRAAAYEDIVKRWTRHENVTLLQELRTTLRVFSTFHAPEYTSAYIAKRQAMFSLPPRDVRKLRQEADDTWSEYFPFTVAAATHDMDWNDFDRDDSQWRLSLANGQGEQVAASMIKRRRRLTNTDEALLPHLGMFYQVYEVRFPRRQPDGRPLLTHNTDRLMLRVTGPLGEATMVWHLKK